MPPTTTTKFGLLKPQVGGDNNQWGDTLNATLDQVDQALSMVGTPIVADVAARTALFPVPKIDSITAVKALGYQTRFGLSAAGINKWLFEGLTRAAGPVTTTNSKGLEGDGATDDSAAFIAAEASALASGGRHEIDLASFNSNGIALTRIFINANVTIATPFRPNPGPARIYVAAGKTFTVNGLFDPGDYAVFDPTSPGNIILNSRQINNPLWFNVIGDGGHNEIPALNKFIAAIPDYSSGEFAGGLVMRLDAKWTITSRRGLRLYGRVSPFPDGSLAAQFRPNFGGGGTMIELFSCDSCEVRNFFVNMGPSNAQYATVGIDIDQTNVGNVTGTHCTIADNVFNALNSPATAYSAVRIGQTAGGNQEYHRVLRNHFFGSGFPFTANNGISATVAGGALGVGIIAGLPNALVVAKQYRVRISGAGAGLGVLDTTLTATAGDRGTLLVAASQPVAGVVCIVGESFGWALNIGGSLSGQAKGIFIADNFFIGFAKAIYLQNGSFRAEDNNFNGNEVDIQCDNATSTCENHFSDSEQSRQHAILNNSYGMPFRFQSCRWGNLCQGPSKGWLELNSGAPIEVVDAEFDNLPVAGTFSIAYDFTNFSGSFRASANRYAGNWTSTQVGYTTIDAQGNIVYPKQAANRIESVGEIGIIGWPTHWISGETLVARGADVAGTGIFETQTQGATIPKHVGLIGRVLVTKNSNESDVLVGIQGTVIKNFGGGGLVRWTKKANMIEAVLPVVNAETFTPVWLHGFHVVAPIMSGGGAGVPIAGVYIEDLQAGGGATTPTNTAGVQQIGFNDSNTLNGVTTTGSSRVIKATVYVDIGAGGNATPNPGVGGSETYRYRIAGAATINQPLNPLKGMMFKLIIFNNTAGAITPTLNGVFLGTGFGAIGAGKSRSRHYIYDDVRTAWEPVGAVSEDF